MTTNYATNQLNQYVQVGAASMSYDLDGNLVTRSDAGATTKYTYDVRPIDRRDRCRATIGSINTTDSATAAVRFTTVKRRSTWLTRGCSAMSLVNTACVLCSLAIRMGLDW